MLSLIEAAAYLGISQKKLRRLKSSGKIQYHQDGRSQILFKKEWLDAWIESGTHTPEDRPPASSSKRRRKSTSRAPLMSGTDEHGLSYALIQPPLPQTPAIAIPAKSGGQ